MALLLRPVSAARHGSCTCVASVVFMAVVVCCHQPARAQVDTEAARNARAALAELRQEYGDSSNWRLWEERLAADDLDRELMAGQYADRRVVDNAAGVLKKSSQSQSLPAAFQRLADALAARSEELAPIPPAGWPAECRRQADNFTAATPHDLTRRKKRLGELLDALQRRMPSLREVGSHWSNYVDWPTTRRLADANPADAATLAELPEAADLDRLETRWATALTVWDAPELVEASFAMQAYIRDLRALRKGETAEAHAAAWNELADLLEARRSTTDATDASDPADATDADATDADGADSADAAASPASSAARIAELLAERESLGQSSPLTTSIRRELSHPNVVARIDANWLASQIQSSVDEKYEVDGVYGGTRSRGKGRIKGNLAMALVPSQSSGKWRLAFQATARSDTVGSDQGVSVESRGTTRIRGEKLFSLSARGLTADRAAASAKTTVEIQDISAGGRIRNNRAPAEVRARIPAVQADVSADAERTTISRLDSEGSKLVERFNNNYHENFRNPWITSGRLLPRIRAASTEQALHWECFLAPAYGLAADAPPPAFDGDGGVMVCVAESALEQQAVAAWAGRKVSGDEMLRAVGQLLGEAPATDSNEEAAPAEPTEQTWNVSFADTPCRVSMADGIVTASLYFTSFEDRGSSFPALTVEVNYAVEARDGDLVLVRQGKPSVTPTASPDGERKPLTGRQRTLRTIAQRQFEQVLSEEIVWSGMAMPVSSKSSAPKLRVYKAQASGGWLQVALSSEAAQSP